MITVQKRISEYRTFRDWIWDQWLESGLESAREFADRVGVSQQTMSQYLNGKAIPTPATIKKMAAALSVDRDDLLKLAGHGPGDRRPPINYDIDAVEPPKPKFSIRELTPEEQLQFLRDVSNARKLLQEIEQRWGISAQERADID